MKNVLKIKFDWFTIYLAFYKAFWFARETRMFDKNVKI